MVIQKRRAFPSVESGQSIVEFLVAATFVLVPSLFLITSLGKIGDLQHRTYEAARYGVWETARTNKSSTTINAEIDSRLIHAPGGALDSVKDGNPAELDPADIDRLYYHTDENGKYTPMVKDGSGVYSETTIKNDEIDSSLYQAKVSIARLGPARIDVAKDGFVTSLVTYSLNDMKWIDLSGFRQSASNTMLIETWRAVTHDAVEDAIDNAVLARAGIFDSAVLDMGTQIAETLGLEEFAGFEPGYIEHDVVPCSRVVKGGEDESACY